MVTYRQAGRGVVRVVRAMEREAARAEKRQIAYEKAAQKQALLEAAAEASEKYNALIDALTGAHRLAFQPLDWRALAEKPRREPPVKASIHEDAAKGVLANYRPSWFAKTFGLEHGQRAKLEELVEAGRRRDAAHFAEHERLALKRNEEIERAQRLLGGDQKAIMWALDKHSRLGDMPFCLEGVRIIFAEDGRLIANVNGLEVDDLPTHSVKLLASGRASVKPLTTTKIVELHRDNVCSSAVRVAVEFLQAIPIDQIEVLMSAELLDPGSGHISSRPVLYLKVSRQALETLNLRDTEPTPLVERLEGRLNWSRKGGLSEIDVEGLGIRNDEADANASSRLSQ